METGSEIIKKRPKRFLYTFSRFLGLTRVKSSWKRKRSYSRMSLLLVITLNTSTKSFIIKEVRAVIKNLNTKKMPGYLIINQFLQKLLEIKIKYIIQLCNAIPKTSFPQWKVVQINMIQKSGRSAELAESYRPVSLVFVKLFNKLPRFSIISLN